MTSHTSTYPTYRMTTSKAGVQHGELAVRSLDAARRTFEGLQRAGVADQAAVFEPGAIFAVELLGATA
jgi:hypothetical protein